MTHVDPKSARDRARRELARIAENVGSDLRTDEFLGETLFKLESEFLVLRVWHLLHRVTLGAVTKRDIFVVCNAVRWHKLTIEQAAIERFPHLRSEIEERQDQ